VHHGAATATCHRRDAEDAGRRPATGPSRDRAVRDCVIDAFAQLEFPAPEGGIVTVVYPIMLAPG
jgi:hypothetical protein